VIGRNWVIPVFRYIVGCFDSGFGLVDPYFLLVFNSNYGPILLSFRDMTMGQTGRQTDRLTDN